MPDSIVVESALPGPVTNLVLVFNPTLPYTAHANELIYNGSAGTITLPTAPPNATEVAVVGAAACTIAAGSGDTSLVTNVSINTIVHLVYYNAAHSGIGAALWVPLNNDVGIATYVAKGAIAVGSGSAAVMTLLAGLDGRILMTDAAQTTGVKWTSPWSQAVVAQQLNFG